MKFAFILFTFLFHNQPSDLIEMRNLFPIIGKKEIAAESLKAISTKTQATSKSIKLAYYSAAHMASAKYKINPYSKYKAFVTGRDLLESSIAGDSTNIETRFIRFIIQNHAPGFLGYNKNIETDKKFIFKNLSAVQKNDIDLYSRIYAFLVTTTKISELDKLSLTSK